LVSCRSIVAQHQRWLVSLFSAELVEPESVTGIGMVNPTKDGSVLVKYFHWKFSTY
jgi:hypothetical protein